jgi:hypothetical protein
MADPLHDNPRSPRKKFDPEGDDYDYDTAKAAGLAPSEEEGENKGHWPSRDPKSGVLLKGKKHPTFQKAVDEDDKLGYKLRKREDGRYVTEKDDD